MHPRIAFMFILLLMTLWGILLYTLVGLAPEPEGEDAAQVAEAADGTATAATDGDSAATTDAATTEPATEQPATADTGTQGDTTSEQTATTDTAQVAATGGQDTSTGDADSMPMPEPNVAPSPTTSSDREFASKTVQLDNFNTLYQRGERLLSLLEPQRPDADFIRSALGRDGIALVVGTIEQVTADGPNSFMVRIRTENDIAIRFWDIPLGTEYWTFIPEESGRRVVALIQPQYDRIQSRILNARPLGVFSDATIGRAMAQRAWDAHMARLDSVDEAQEQAKRDAALSAAIKERDDWRTIQPAVASALDEIIRCEQAAVSPCNTPQRLARIHSILDPMGVSITDLQAPGDTLNSLTEKVKNALTDKFLEAQSRVEQLGGQ
ncbi:MAG: hypothetical protein Alpg2KO_20180 [Alphaproteobacteria bacterium]